MSKIIPFLILLLFVQACNLPVASSATPTVELSLPTNTIEIAPATETPAVVAPDPTATTDVGGELEAILILQPGMLSVVTSPITVAGQSRPTFEQNLVVAVYDQDGAILSFQPTTIMSEMGSPGPFTTELSFSVGSEQPGRISVYETSALDGGIIHLASVEVTLRPAGTAEILPAEIGLEDIAIQFPPANVEVPSGSIVVTGFSDYYFESTLGLLLCGGGGSGAPHDLCGTEDNILASGVAMIDVLEMGQPGPFSGELNFSVSEPTPGRFVVFASSPRDGGWLHVTSIPVLLVP